MVIRFVLTLVICAVQTKDYMRVLCAGDSLTTGSYPAFLFKGFNGLTDVQVVAESGIRASDIVKRVKNHIENGHVPTHVVLYAGINDCIGEGYGGRKGMDKVAILAVIEAAEYAQKINIDLIVVKHHPWAGSRYDTYGRSTDCSVRFNYSLTKLENEHDFIQVVDTSLLGNRGSLSKKYDGGDGLHLNSSGYALLASEIRRQVIW